jgi:NADP-dependent 3-hydroxy acid dehydrogenase YdfG
MLVLAARNEQALADAVAECEALGAKAIAVKTDVTDANALKELVNKVDVIVLAQASMARVVATLDERDRKVPILASPEIAIQHLASVL